VKLVLTALVISVAGFGSPAAAQSDSAQPVDSTIALLRKLGASAGLLRQTWMHALEDPETLNLVLQQLFADDRWRLLKDLNLRFDTFASDAGDARGLGLSYAYAKTIKRDDLINRGAHQAGLAFTLNAAGNIAFKRSINPRDFLQADGRLALWRSTGGAVATTDEVRDRLAVLRRKLALISVQEELDNSPLWAEYLATVGRSLTTQAYLDLGASGGIESDQSFDQTQYVYALSLGLDVKAWNRTSRLAAWNLFDWPFAAIRYLAGTDSVFRPRGSNIPTLRMQLGLVDPGAGSTRETLGAAGSFPRFSLEAAMRNLILHSQLGDVYVESDLRWFREVGAPPTVAAAGLDEFTYFAAALVSSAGPYASYSTGRLPFDVRNDQVYELGFKLLF
jgi:hypothetical protein